MDSKFKICIYLKGREKPIILTDVITPEHTYQETVKFFQEELKGDNKIITLEFSNDNFVFNTRDLECVVVSKPSLDNLSLVTDGDISKEAGIVPLKNELDQSDTNHENDIIGEDPETTTKVEIVED